ncbi:sensor domain-containing diguanylate cyclase [Leptolyngbya ohadii]|uniref:sensor domain-containing diguanylate cyclase n=1 Tax=Leptolyngbya ohadii TaxID=1962290 RepID=UPI000B59BD2F|nr:diguanylate cyclase [Leptolyngbya ohadii]
MPLPKCSLLLPQPIRLIALNLGIAIAYSVATKLSVDFASLPGKVTAVWLPSGITLALVAWMGGWALPGIALGSIVGLWRPLTTMNPPLSILGFLFLQSACVLANCLQPTAGIAIIKSLTGTLPAFDRVRSVAAFVLAAVVAPSLSATSGVGALCLLKALNWRQFGVSWLTWWLASVVAILVFTPPLLLRGKRSRFQPKTSSKTSWVEFVLLLGLGLVLSWVTFIQGYPVESSLLPVLMIAVFRLGSFSTSVLVSIVAGIAIVCTANGMGPYADEATTKSFLLLQSFVAVFSVTTLLLSAVLQERKVAEAALEQTLASLEQQVEARTAELNESQAILDGFFSTAPVGMGIVDQQLQYVKVNKLLAEINGTTVEAHLGQPVRRIIPNLAPDLESVHQQVLATGQPILNREESSFKSAQDTRRIWLTSYFPILDVSQVPAKVGVIVMEISDLKRLEAKLKQQARQDELTTLSNRLHFKEASELEWRRCIREQKPFSLILLDIDEFKRYNDTYGHLAGDWCLIQFAKLLRESVKRPGDLIARYGGEEFIVMLPDTTVEGASHIANHLRQHIHQQQIPHCNSSVSKFVTASLGVATCIPRSDLRVEDLIQAADEALYESKRQGRDRVTTQTIE